MNTLKTKLAFVSSTLPGLAAGALLLCGAKAQAINYPGNGDSSFGGDIGNSVMTWTDNGTNISGTITCGNGGNMYNVLVIYVDTGTGGGFLNTSNFSDVNDGNRSAISGCQISGQQTNRSGMTFVSGFAPQYAIAIGPSATSYGGIWKLANGGNNSLPYVDSVNLSPLQSQGPFTFSFPASDLGLTNGVPTTVKIFGTYISNSGYRSSEATAGNDSGTAGWNPHFQTAYSTYNFDTPAAPPVPVTFQVDMTAQIASGAFNPGNGDTAYAAGTFQTNQLWSGFQLTPSAGNTNIYVGTYLDENQTNSMELFKFFFYSVGNNSTNWETMDNRPSTLQSSSQTLPLVYFDDVFPTPSATTNALSFSIDMTAQIDLGNFNPANGDQIEVLGTFENPKWTAGFILTNNPGSVASNVYSGTIADGNYPGSFEEYKFVIVPGGVVGSAVYESGNDRMFFTPTNASTFPTAYFDNIISAYSIPVTFQVDMTVPLLTGTFDPGNGDLISAAGTFQSPLTASQWLPGIFILTNNPTGANPNLYTGTYIDQNAPGTFEQFKFQIDSPNTSSTNWESINNRGFTLGSSAETLPAVTWNDQDTNTVLLQPTTITFTVNMTNAVDVFGNPFDPANDDVMIAGTFTNPQWVLNWTDPLISSDYGQYVLQNNPAGSLLYTGTFTVPAGTPYGVQYKYGIDHNAGNLNTNTDNEAGFGLNHTRYIRTAGAYSFPLDTFGIQQTNLTAATETAFGNLTIGNPTAGHFAISWLGLPGVHMQVSTNLFIWADVTATTGLNATNWPAAGNNEYFRLVQP